MPAEIDYYFTLASPFSYLGHRRLGEIARRHGAAVRLKPIDLSQVFPLSGGLPLARRAPQRQAYRLIELRRWSAHLGVPLNPQPRYFPVQDGLARLMVIAADHQGRDAWGLTEALMHAVWADERDIADETTLIAVAESCGFGGRDLLAQAGRPETTAALDAYTAEAIDRQVFGVPSYVLRGELFWGQDRLDFLDRALAAGPAPASGD